MVIETRSKKKNKIIKKEKVINKKEIKNEPPKNKKNLYSWLKNNNLLLTESQITELGLIDDSKKVIWHEFVFGCPPCEWKRIYAVLPEGYHWDIN
jgi:hypothetical protein